MTKTTEPETTESNTTRRRVMIGGAALMGAATAGLAGCIDEEALGDGDEDEDDSGVSYPTPPSDISGIDDEWQRYWMESLHFQNRAIAALYDRRND